MPRPKRCRRICGFPDYWSFAPESGDTDETILFMLDEFEAIRLIDYENLTQEECAEAMQVSRATVAGIYERARFKIADAMMNGKRIRITGGAYCMDSVPSTTGILKKGEDTMRIAVTYEQEMVGQHFGRTEQFKLYDVSDGKVKGSQIIDTNGTGHGALAGFLRAADVEVLICGGIGMGARNAIAATGMKLFPGVSGKADDVIAAYLAGSLDFNPDEACDHHGHGEGHDCHQGDGCGAGGCH